MKNFKKYGKSRALAPLLTIVLTLALVPATALASKDFEAVYQHNLKIYNSKGTNEFAQAYYLLPSSEIQSDEKEIIDLANSIISGISGDRAKAKAINDWVAKNIYYDWDRYNSRTVADNSSTEALQSKRAVCEGFSNLTAALLRAAGIPAKHVKGYAILPGQNTDIFFDLNSRQDNHSWNEAFVGGKWIIIDATWNTYNKFENGKFQSGNTRDTYFDISLKDISQSHKYRDYDDFYLRNDVIVNAQTNEAIKAALDISAVTSIVIPDCVKSIGNAAFQNCTALVSVVIPDSVTSIGTSAFSGCSALTSIVIPDSVTSIGASVFRRCTALTSIVLSNNITSIGNSAFTGCTSLTSIVIPDSVTSIGSRSFENCTALTSVVLSNNLISIDQNAFENCTSLTSAIIPDSVTSINAWAFRGCTSLAYAVVPKGVRDINGVFEDCAEDFILFVEAGSPAHRQAPTQGVRFELISEMPFILALPLASEWARDGIVSAIEKDLVPKKLQVSYTNNITRAEFASLAVALYETAVGEEITGRMSFTDTDDINVEKAAYIGVVRGVGGDRFDPDAPLNRQQAATMLSRLAAAAGKPFESHAPTFADNAQIADWAADEVGQVQAAGIMGGVGGNQFAPNDPYTKEQSIITILRLYNYLPPAAYIVFNGPTVNDVTSDGLHVGPYGDQRAPVMVNIGGEWALKAAANDFVYFGITNDAVRNAENILLEVTYYDGDQGFAITYCSVYRDHQGNLNNFHSPDFDFPINNSGQYVTVQLLLEGCNFTSEIGHKPGMQFRFTENAIIKSIRLTLPEPAESIVPDFEGE